MSAGTEVEEVEDVDAEVFSSLERLKGVYAAASSSKEVLEQIAVLTRKEINRKPLADSGLIKDLLVNDGKSEDKEIQSLLCRIIGNLCFENEENRDRVLEAGGVPFLLRCLKTAEPSVVRCAAGALANVVCEHEKCQKAVIDEGVVPLLMSNLEGSEESKSMVLRAITNLGESATSQKVLAESGAVAKILALLGGPKFGDDIQAEAINALTALSKHTESGIEIVRHGAKKLIDLGSESDITKHDITLVAGAFQFLMELSEINELKKPFLTYGYIPMMEEVIKTSSNSNVRRSFAKILSNLSTDDECMMFMFSSLDFYASLLDSSEVEMQIMSCMILGNLARNDDHCKKIVENGIAKKLVSRLENTEDPRVIQLALGAIRNTSLQVVENKNFFMNEGIFKLIQKFMKEGNHHTKFVSVGVIKSLVSGPENLLKEYLSDPVNIQTLLSVAKEDPSEGNERVQYEASRVLVILLQRNKDLVHQIIQHHDNHKDDEKQEKEGGEGGEGATKEQMFKPFVFLMKSPFEILNLEGLKALHIIASDEKGKLALQGDKQVSEHLLKAQQSTNPTIQHFFTSPSPLLSLLSSSAQ